MSRTRHRQVTEKVTDRSLTPTKLRTGHGQVPDKVTGTGHGQVKNKSRTNLRTGHGHEFNECRAK